jgi:uncharacterized protein (DUF924 family)
MAAWSDILRFWFRETDPAQWWKKDAAFDRRLTERFAARVEEAAAGGFDEWRRDAKGALALILLLDQFPRNIWRGTARASATDAEAKIVAEAAIAAGLDKGLSADERLFLYLPFEHSENLDDQERAVALVRTLGNAYYLKFAEAHRDVIRRFGRFPHRNRALGRANTPAEDEYLKDPNAGF